MPIIVQQSAITNVPSNATTTCSDICSAVASDVRQLMGAEHPNLIDYTNRVQKKILRNDKHPFLLSTPQRFITQLGVTDYWIGTSGSASSGTYDTGLNLTDFGFLKPDEVWDRTNEHQLGRVARLPNNYGFEYKDASARYGLPRDYANEQITSKTLSIYPAPDNQNTYQPVPLAPLVTTAAGGALSARTYYVRISLVDSAGSESSASLDAIIRVPASYLLKVRSPQLAISASASGITYASYKVYASTTENSEVLQSTSVTIGTDWTEPTTGLISGVAYPTTNSIEALRGYVIDFRYFKARQTVTSISDTLQIPDDYKDIVIAGVNELAFKWLRKFDDMAIEGQRFKDGIRQITRDKNLMGDNGASAFMRPDSGAIV